MYLYNIYTHVIISWFQYSGTTLKFLDFFLLLLFLSGVARPCLHATHTELYLPYLTIA